MKVLTVLQPWASLIMHGCKRLEYRSWYTSHRGLLAIHAGRRFDARQRRVCGEQPIKDQLTGAGIACVSAMPLGAILGVVTMMDCDPIHGAVELLPTSGCGFAWRFTWPLLLPAPMPYRGQLRLCHLPPDIAAVLEALVHAADTRPLVAAS